MKPLYLILLLALGLITSCESEEDKLQATIEKEKLALEQWKVDHKALTTKRSALSLERQKLQGDCSATIRRKEQEYRLETMSQCQKDVTTLEQEHRLKINVAQKKANDMLKQGQNIVLANYYTPINDHYYGTIRDVKKMAQDNIASFKKTITEKVTAEYTPKIEKLTEELKLLDAQISEHRKNTPQSSALQGYQLKTLSQ